jgi:multidrug transporter EmrE-like cation transporter
MYLSVLILTILKSVIGPILLKWSTISIQLPKILPLTLFTSSSFIMGGFFFSFSIMFNFSLWGRIRTSCESPYIEPIKMKPFDK